jgi:hypothetical protein
MNDHTNPSRFLRRNNWRSNSRQIYPWKLDFTIEDERYCLETNTILQTTTEISIKSNHFTPRTYSPHHLLKEDEPSVREYLTLVGENLQNRHYYGRLLKKRARLLGDVPIEYNNRTLIRSSDRLDKTWNPNNCPRRYSTEEKINNILQENEFLLTKNQYIEVVKDLNITSPHTTIVQRPHKRVYFSHELHYYSFDQENIPKSDILPPIKDYIFVGDPSNNITLIGKTSRGPRHIRSPIPPYQSILKHSTGQGKFDSYWEYRIRNNGFHSSNYQEIGFSVRYYLYHKLLADTSDHFSTWFRNNRDIIKSSEEINQTYQYYINRKFRHDLIDEAVVLQLQHTEAANKIIKSYRKWKEAIIYRNYYLYQSRIIDITNNRQS